MRNRNLYKTPFSRAYWKDAASEMKNIRILTFSALMIAVKIAVAQVPYIPLPNGVRVTWDFLASSLCSMVCGPVCGLAVGFIEDNLSFMVHPSGVYFPGYTLTAMLGNMIYALFLYRARVTFARVAASKFCTNVMNVFLGSLWNYMLIGSKSYWVYFTTSLIKNAVMFPVQTVMLALLFRAARPALRRVNLVPGDDCRITAY